MAEPQLSDITAEGGVIKEKIRDHSDLRRGDHLAVGNRKCCVKYSHHGIYLGSEKGVADFGVQPNKMPRAVGIHAFTNNNKRDLIRINYAPKCCLDPEVAAMRAEDLIENPTNLGEYDLVANNCEHFATFCKTGLRGSDQVIEHIRKALKNPIKCCALNMCVSCHE